MVKSIVYVTQTDTHVAVTCLDSIKPSQPIGSAETNPWFEEEGWWWLCRVKVNEKSQRSGIGTLLLMNLQKVLQAKGVRGLVVAPGGYGSDLSRLVKFYEANGFVQDKDHGLLRWTAKTENQTPLEA